MIFRLPKVLEDEAKQEVIRAAQQRGDFMHLEKAGWKLFHNQTVLNSYQLRVLADELDRRNK